MERKLMLVDDDPNVHVIVKNCVRKDFDIISCFTLKEAMTLIDQGTAPSILLVDRMLPDGDGLDLCAKFRSVPGLESNPVIFLSGLSTESDKVSGLYAGADDYVTKPFGPLELRARIQARFRTASRKIHVGNVLIEIDSQRAYVAGPSGESELELTRTEFKLLSLFADCPDRIFSRDEILNRIWGENFELSDRAIDTHVSHLRKKLGASSIEIESKRGEGYRLLLRKISAKAN